MFKVGIEDKGMIVIVMVVLDWVIIRVVMYLYDVIIVL